MNNVHFFTMVTVMVIVDLVSVTQVQTPHRDCFRADFLFKNNEGSTTNKKLNYWLLCLKHLFEIHLKPRNLSWEQLSQVPQLTLHKKSQFPSTSYTCVRGMLFNYLF